MFAKVEIDKSDLLAAQALLAGVKNGYPKAMSRALNAGLSTSAVESRRKVQEIVTAKTKYVNRAFVQNKATYGKLTASLVAAGTPLPMIAYDVRQTARGVSVKIEKAGTRSLLKHAFISIMKNVTKIGDIVEHTGVFFREERFRKYANTGQWPEGKARKFKPPDPYRLKVKQLWGPSLPAIFERGEILDHVQAVGAAKAADELGRQVDLLLTA